MSPFLVDESNVIKIRKAKDIVIARMAEPPSLQELSDEIGLSLKKLKEGFKQIYGDTVFSFLFAKLGLKWVTVQLAILLQPLKRNIVLHLKNIYNL